MAKPKKRRKNVINDKRLKNLFVLSKNYYVSQLSGNFVEDVPQDYDPYHRVKQMK